jgi:predicted RNA methylase
MPKKVEITPEVREVLANSTIHGTAQNPVVVLPPGQLDRTLYVEVDKALKALGGKWSRVHLGHVFDRPVEGELAEALTSGVAVDQARTAEQFFTPILIAEQVFDRARLAAGMRVLEPSAGEGALLRRPLAYGCEVIAVERDGRLVQKLIDRMCGRGGTTTACGDFLEWKPDPADPPIDRVLMNPPFGKGADMVHVRRALGFLRPGGILVAIMSPGWTYRSDRQAAEFRAVLAGHEYLWDPLPEGSFKSSGTSVSTGILTIHKGEI